MDKYVWLVGVKNSDRRDARLHHVGTKEECELIAAALKNGASMAGLNMKNIVLAEVPEEAREWSNEDFSKFVWS
jgi:hypothetical protein